jgi:hypothetical protein
MGRTALLPLAAWLWSAQIAKPPETVTPAAATGTIHGVVKDANTGAPLPDISIRVVRVSAEGRPLGQFGAVADEAGNYSIGNGRQSKSERAPF